MADKKLTDSGRAEKRPKRVPLYKSRILDGKERPGFMRRWVNETPGRVEMFEAAGWTLVTGHGEDTSVKRAQSESQQTSVVRRVVNRAYDAESKTAVLMEIPEELYKEDQAEKQKRNDLFEESIKPSGKIRSGEVDYGNFNIERK